MVTLLQAMKEFVQGNDIGFIVNYKYDETWDLLYKVDIKEILRRGRNGRKIYEERYSYRKNYENKLNTIIDPIT